MVGLGITVIVICNIRWPEAGSRLCSRMPLPSHFSPSTIWYQSTASVSQLIHPSINSLFSIHLQVILVKWRYMTHARCTMQCHHPRPGCVDLSRGHCPAPGAFCGAMVRSPAPHTRWCREGPCLLGTVQTVAPQPTGTSWPCIHTRC